MTFPLNFLVQLGLFFRYSYLGKLSLLGVSIALSPFRKEGNSRVLFSTFKSQILFTGVEAVPHIVILAMVVGVLTILQAFTVMPKVGGSGALGDLMVTVVLRELGPLVTALFLTGRTGSALATYIGNMQALQEIDALKAMGINPIHYQIMPAFYGSMLSCFSLTMIFNLTALMGGYFITWCIAIILPELFSSHVSFSLFVERVFESMTLTDFMLVVFKPLVFGSCVAVIACFHGMTVHRDVRDVPKATRMTVVRTFVVIAVLDMIFALPFLLQLKDKILV